jgi:uncharacterized protein YxeA
MKKQQIVILLLFTMLTPCLLQAQKKELDQARTYIKSGKDFDKAEKLMTDLLKKDTANRHNKKIYDTWLESLEGQYAAANEKFYLKQKYDTAAFYKIVHRMYVVAETLDSLDMVPDKKGRVKLEFRKSNAAMLDRLRPNLYNGGNYNVNHNDYKTAYTFFSTYIDADSQPLFTGYKYLTSDQRMPTAAYWATYCGFRMEDAPRTLAYSELALKDVSKQQYTLMYVCEAHLKLGNQSDYIAMLHRGFESFPENQYFFPRLADYYKDRGENEKMLDLAEQGLRRIPNNKLFLMAKSIALLNMSQYDECISVSRQMIANDKSQSEPYFNIATCYLNQALTLEQLNEPRKYRQQLVKLYTEARPHMEKYRELAPRDIERWGPALYRIYLNLNKGKQFEEIDRLMKQQ